MVKPKILNYQIVALNKKYDLTFEVKDFSTMLQDKLELFNSQQIFDEQ